MVKYCMLIKFRKQRPEGEKLPDKFFAIFAKFSKLSPREKKFFFFFFFSELAKLTFEIRFSIMPTDSLTINEVKEALFHLK